MKSRSASLGSELVPERLQTNGVRAVSRAIFNIRFSGNDVFDLLKLLEGGATEAHTTSFLEVRKCVFLAEKVRNQARRQGF